MRTFIALELSEEIKRDLSRLEAHLKAADADVKWVKPENIHLTLKFLGEVAEEKIEKIKGILDDISAQHKPVEISMFGLGGFPNLNQLRVIWVGIERGCAEVESIATSIENRFEEIGFQKEERPFSAHLTLGRTRSGRNKDGLKKQISSAQIKPLSCVIKHITLFKSTLTPTGPIYTAIHNAMFKP